MGLPTSESHIENAERQGCFALPPLWKQMLLHSNGFELDASEDCWIAFPVWDDSSRKHIARSANHILRETQTMRGYAGFPAEAVSIASNGSGDVLVLIPGGSDVYIWHHETGELKLTEVSYPGANKEFED
jgi:hypothetical protein